MFKIPNCCYLKLGLLKRFTGTLRGNNLLFVQSEQADAQHNYSLWLGYLVILSFFLFLPAKMEFVVNVYYCVALKAVYI